MPKKRVNRKRLTETELKIKALRTLIFIILGIIVVRLIYLQLFMHDFYQAIAAKEHYGYTELPARRGEIFIKDYASGENIRVATNITLDTIYADPTIIEDKKLVADRITPLIFDLEAEKEKEKEKEQKRVETEQKKAKTDEEREKIKPLTDEELYSTYYNTLLNNINQEIRPIILLSDTMEETALKEVEKIGMPGIEVKDNNLYAYPEQITDRDTAASVLSKYIDLSPTRLKQILEGKNRYVILAKKVKPELSAKVKELIENDENNNFVGIGFKEEYYRFYPENTLSANALGFVTPDGIGKYGIERKFNTQLQGKTGEFQTQRDGSMYGRQITVGDSVIRPAVDGDDIVLTIDRSMQMTIEKILENDVKNYRADSGQVIVMDPNTGKIMAMAYYPSFDANNYGQAMETQEISLSPEEVGSLVPIEDEENSFWFYRNISANDRYKVMREPIEDEGNEGEPTSYIYKRYKNWIGLEAYQNKIVSLPYEPGSAFKAITMASAIDGEVVEPSTAFRDPGVLEVDEFEITNVSPKCTGYVTMTNILEQSCNTGIAWVANQMGPNLFYSYMLRFGFGERSGIEFDNEHPGRIEHFRGWADSELATHGFGQGITATAVQMAAAYSALANGGTLMQPHVVEKIIKKNGKEIKSEVKSINQVISEDTSQKITAMLINAVENGVAENAAVENHYVAAKTGTSQTYKHGQPLKGAGTTITSIAGYGPVKNPKFVIIVKFDRPRSSEWGSDTAAPTFSKIATYLYEYFGVAPDK
jgi:cell division protein FtsI/penicillin-binding protein 2